MGGVLCRNDRVNHETDRHIYRMEGDKSLRRRLAFGEIDESGLGLKDDDFHLVEKVLVEMCCEEDNRCYRGVRKSAQNFVNGFESRESRKSVPLLWKCYKAVKADMFTADPMIFKVMERMFFGEDWLDHKLQKSWDIRNLFDQMRTSIVAVKDKRVAILEAQVKPGESYPAGADRDVYDSCCKMESFCGHVIDHLPSQPPKPEE